MRSVAAVRDFVAVVDSCPTVKWASFKGMLHIRGLRVQAEIRPCQPENERQEEPVYIHVHTSQPLPIKWMDRFYIRTAGGDAFQWQGSVIYPIRKKKCVHDLKKRPALLRGLSGTGTDMVRAMSRQRGIQGLTEQDLVSFCSISHEDLVRIGKELEGEAAVKIVCFSPLLFLSRDCFEYLREKILAYISNYHREHPGEIGIPVETIERKFKLHPRILSLALKHLFRTGEVKGSTQHIARAGFQANLSPEEEKLLQDLEAMSMRGKLHSISFDELKARFHLSAKSLNKLLVFLIERNKIVKGKDGFFIHSKWLNDLIRDLRNLENKELSVKDFKQMTGLTRKYAIPLLELLDQMGVTRRKGPHREIL